MNVLQEIFSDYYEEIKYTLHPRKSEMENIDKMINCGDSSFGGPCTHALLAEILNLSLSAATVVFAPLAETNIPWNALPVCPLS